MKYIMLLSTLFFALNVHAEVMTDDDLSMADEALSTPAMNIEGQYHTKEETKPAPIKVKKLSQSDRLKLYRERLEERNRIMIEKKMEQIRYQQELALARKLEQSMNQTLKAIEK